MKRKIIQMAGKTMVVSIPSDVVKKYNLKKGQELDVSEENGKVSILMERPLYKQPCELKAEEYMVQEQLKVLYTQGYDEIKVSYEDKNILKDIIRDVNKKFSGFEVLESNGSYCIIKSIMKEDDTKLQSLIRRSFLILLSLIENYDEVSMENLIKVANVCKRMLHQKAYSLNEALTMYNLITIIEEISLVKYSDKKLAKELIEQIYPLYYKFDESQFIKIKHKIEKERNSTIIKKDTNSAIFLYNTKKLLDIVSIKNIQIKPCAAFAL